MRHIGFVISSLASIFYLFRFSWAILEFPEPSSVLPLYDVFLPSDRKLRWLKGKIRGAGMVETSSVWRINNQCLQTWQSYFKASSCHSISLFMTCNLKIGNRKSCQIFNGFENGDDKCSVLENILETFISSELK